jgi:methylglutaconyl-CoA hydratase
MDPLVHLDTRGGVATITLDSPANRNALSTRLLGQLDAALTQALTDDTVRVLVLTGTGPVFCSGADLKEQTPFSPAGLKEQTPTGTAGAKERTPTETADPKKQARTGTADPKDQAPTGAPVTGAFPRVLSTIWDSPKPVICRLNGTARAGGLGLVAACDFAIAPDSATFAFSEVRLGVVPAMIAVTVLRRLDPRAAAEYFLTGEIFDATRAVEIGLLTRAVPADELDTAVGHYASMLLRGGPESLAITKRLVRTVPGLPLDEGLRRMAALSAERFTSAEGQEGIRAFMEKRPASWIPTEDPS